MVTFTTVITLCDPPPASLLNQYGKGRQCEQGEVPSTGTMEISLQVFLYSSAY